MLFHQPFHLAGAGHRVPLAQVAAHRQHQRIGVAGGFRQSQRLIGAEAGAFVGGGELMVFVEAFGFCGGGAAAGIGPLLRSFAFQQFMAEAAHIAKPALGESREFGVHLSC